ncbi:cytochrome b6-f complex subunit V (PetG) [Synechococcus elongatus PCC 6301]|nr:cytochrome b6-f complex subunit V (PetG) [Synechococcus elongatus PCC 6301]
MAAYLQYRRGNQLGA